MGGAGPETGVAMEHLTQTTRVEGYDAVRLRSASAQVDATFVPAVGMVGASRQITAPTNALATGDRLVLLGPGGRYTATFSITVERRAR